MPSKLGNCLASDTESHHTRHGSSEIALSELQSHMARLQNVWILCYVLKQWEHQLWKSSTELAHYMSVIIKSIHFVCHNCCKFFLELYFVYFIITSIICTLQFIYVCSVVIIAPCLAVSADCETGFCITLQASVLQVLLLSGLWAIF
jgi:hypothetical protein